ncbi:MAG TPA: hypothetical protein VH063_05800 [Gaiellaceae bacterium]|jgi:hypothetical protein|nr:hypothetical protein [Gaiellaceae bacterium]
MPELPAALPPAQRTIGQFIGETIRTYSAHFWRAVPLGIPLAVADQLSVHQSPKLQIVIFWALGPLVVAAYVRAVSIVYEVRPALTPYLVGLLIYAPFPILRAAFFLPGIAWFALIGLAVPAALVERLRFREALIRGRRLGAADYVHSLGSLASLVIVVGIAEITLTALLHSQSGNSQRVALLLADLILSPLLFLGGALLYQDQAARVGSRHPNSRSARDADLHPPVDPDPAGRPDAEGQS